MNQLYIYSLVKKNIRIEIGKSFKPLLQLSWKQNAIISKILEREDSGHGKTVGNNFNYKLKEFLT